MESSSKESSSNKNELLQQQRIELARLIKLVEQELRPLLDQLPARPGIPEKIGERARAIQAASIKSPQFIGADDAWRQAIRLIKIEQLPIIIHTDDKFKEFFGQLYNDHKNIIDKSPKLTKIFAKFIDGDQLHLAKQEAKRREEAEKLLQEFKDRQGERLAMFSTMNDTILANRSNKLAETEKPVIENVEEAQEPPHILATSSTAESNVNLAESTIKPSFENIPKANFFTYLNFFTWNGAHLWYSKLKTEVSAAVILYSNTPEASKIKGSESFNDYLYKTLVEENVDFETKLMDIFNNRIKNDINYSKNQKRAKMKLKPLIDITNTKSNDSVLIDTMEIVNQRFAALFDLIKDANSEIDLNKEVTLESLTSAPNINIKNKNKLIISMMFSFLKTYPFTNKFEIEQLFIIINLALSKNTKEKGARWADHYLQPGSRIVNEAIDKQSNVSHKYIE